MATASSLGTSAEMSRMRFLPALTLNRELLSLPGWSSSSNSRMSSLPSRKASSRDGGSLSVVSLRAESLEKEARSLPSSSSRTPEA